MDIKHIGAQINKMSEAQITKLAKEFVPEVKTFMLGVLSGVHPDVGGGDGDSDFDDGIGGVHDDPAHPDS